MDEQQEPIRNEILSKHWGKILGGLLGLIFAILVITLNLWWAIFIYLCVAVGFFIGWRLDMGGGLRSFFERFFPPREDNW